MKHVERFLSHLNGVSETGNGWKARCPCREHADHTPSMSIALSDLDQRILVNCFGGCTLDEILEAIGINHEDLWPTKEDLEGQDDPASDNLATLKLPPIPAADTGVNCQVYSALKAKLSLSPAHREQLRKRGLTDNQIDRNGYRSLSFFDLRRNVLPSLRNEFGDKLLGVPGFIDKDGKITCVELPAGLLIPVRGIDEGIFALQIRCDNSGQGKYRWFSGGGTTCGSPIHVPLGVDKSDMVRVTEGPLKADVAYALGCNRPPAGRLRRVGKLG